MNAQLQIGPQIQQEAYSDALIAEMKPMLYEHWLEVATFKDRIPLDPDYPAYQMLDGAGKVLCLTARIEGVLVGYSVFLLRRSSHYKSTSAALNDVIYVHPRCRRGSLGLRLIRETESRLKAMGVVKITWHAKPQTQLADLLVRLGYVLDELMLAKVL